MMAKHLGLTYVYEKEPTQEKDAKIEVQVNPARLATLPADLRQQLHRAVIRLDTRRTKELIEQISGHDTQSAAVFQSLADNMQYHSLLACLENKTMPLEDSP